MIESEEEMDGYEVAGEYEYATAEDVMGEDVVVGEDEEE